LADSISSKIDEDLTAMYLTDKKNGLQRVPSDHQELEVLLESFAKQVEEIVNETDTTQARDVPSTVSAVHVY
jgi:magnesium transporter